MITTIEDCQLLQLPQIGGDRKGYITPIYNNEHVPFEIRRVYYLYDIPGGAHRAAHAHKELQQLIVAVMGSFDLIVDDGQRQRRFHLNRAYQGIYMPPMIWRDLDNFSSGAICLVLSSLRYDEEDYIRDYDEFLRAKGH